MKIETPYYLIDEKKLLKNLKIIGTIREISGAKAVLALKCFSTWCVFDLMKEYLDGTTSSSLFEARLGYEKFGKETHAYCVGYSPKDILQLKKISDKIIFNSASQLKQFYPQVRSSSLGLRVNPGISYSCFDLADPARKYSRLGVIDKSVLKTHLPLLSGLMFHFNCENDDFENFSRNLDRIGKDYANFLQKIQWVSLGGGLYFTKAGYPVNKFCKKLKEFSKKFEVQIYLEPGESVITDSCELVTRVVDLVHNKIDIAIVDASIEAHMPDLLTYRIPAKIAHDFSGGFKYMVAGRSCLAGDVFGRFNFKIKLKPGSIIRFADAAGYTMVKKNWFNGLVMPSIMVKRLDNSIDVVRKFSYNDFVKSLS